jgi:pyridoxal phosphate enzyme (YggS family)
MVDVATNYHNIIGRIRDAAAKAGRAAGEVKLLAAAKSQCVQSVEAAIAAGVTIIGENYVQEAQAKKQKLRAPAEWHMIGHLQRNKAKTAVELFDMIESLDSAALARELDKEGAKRGQVVPTLVEINLTGEQNKSGIAKGQLRGLLEETASLAHISVDGLMTVPPFCQEPEQARRYFCELRELAARAADDRLPNVRLSELSMGMSHDYVIAVEEGATIVRIGTALFGPRSR